MKDEKYYRKDNIYFPEMPKSSKICVFKDRNYSEVHFFLNSKWFVKFS